MANENEGCLASILGLFGVKLRGADVSDEASSAPLPFRQRNDFLSPAELSFFQVLIRAVDNQYYVCAKVRLSDVLLVVDRRKNMAHANRIDRKHVDFLLCDLATMQPRLVVELDDSSHQRQNRIERDALVDSACSAAGLPIVHIPAQRGYSTDQIKQQIGSAMGSEIKESKSIFKKNETPTCPKCGVTMVQRTASRGTHKGKRFWACPGYPDCREIVAID